MDDWEITQKINELEKQAISQESIDLLLATIQDVQYDLEDLRDYIK